VCGGACAVVPDELLEKVIGALQQLLVAVRMVGPHYLRQLQKNNKKIKN
jgi:hypothetical protein